MDKQEIKKAIARMGMRPPARVRKAPLLQAEIQVPWRGQEVVRPYYVPTDEPIPERKKYIDIPFNYEEVALLEKTYHADFVADRETNRVLDKMWQDYVSRHPKANVDHITHWPPDRPIAAADFLIIRTYVDRQIKMMLRLYFVPRRKLVVGGGK